MNTLDCLIYLSVSKLQPEDKDTQLADIISVSAQLNQQAGITGILACQDGYFVQLLEGPPAALDLLMLHLHFDKRHDNIEVVARQQILARDVVGWSMITPSDAALPDSGLGQLLESRPTSVEAWRNTLLRLMGQPPKLLTRVQVA